MILTITELSTEVHTITMPGSFLPLVRADRADRADPDLQTMMYHDVSNQDQIRLG